LVVLTLTSGYMFMITLRLPLTAMQSGCCLAFAGAEILGVALFGFVFLRALRIWLRDVRYSLLELLIFSLSAGIFMLIINARSYLGGVSQMFHTMVNFCIVPITGKFPDFATFT